MTLKEAKDFTAWLAGWWIFGLCLTFAIWMLPLSRDSTDGEWPARSGMKPRTDALSGCQYLETYDGGITPRIGANGMHMGCKALVD